MIFIDKLKMVGERGGGGGGRVCNTFIIKVGVHINVHTFVNNGPTIGVLNIFLFVHFTHHLQLTFFDNFEPPNLSRSSSIASIACGPIVPPKLMRFFINIFDSLWVNSSYSNKFSMCV